jgi:hypothetical protein
MVRPLPAWLNLRVLRSLLVVASAILLGCAGGRPQADPATVSLAPLAAASASVRPAYQLPPGDFCSGERIANTDVCDTAENREVLEVCEAYRTALEKRDVEALLALTSKDYFEDGGNEDPSDDIRRAELETYLLDQFKNVQEIRYELRYRKIRLGPTTRVDVTHAASFRFGTEWKRRVSDNTIELRREAGKLLIVGGM